ncbi:putative acetyl-CoA C-acetyltransferase VraB [Arthrobacter sp. Hiyo4]|nr:putative acetyl-CoA C-acetyltransferase VraB [Arthrobacter sp. Hiyo4]
MPPGDVLPPDRQPVIIAARRTAVRRANGALKELRAHQLLAPVLADLLADSRVPAEEVKDVVIGNAVGGGGNVARLALLEAGLPVGVPGLTVDRQCGSGLDAIALAARLVAAGGNPVYLAGGWRASARLRCGPTVTTTASLTFLPGPSLRRTASVTRIWESRPRM